MKKNFLSTCLLTAVLALAGCSGAGTNSLLGGLGQTGSAAGAGNAATNGTVEALVGNLLGSLLGKSATLTQADLVGTWQYTGPDCVFESENLLMQAGGAVAATQIETKMAAALGKVGFKAGSCSFTFKADGTYSAVIGGRTLSGKYTLDAANEKLTMTYLAGVATMNPHVVKTGNSLSLLYEADKLLSLVNGLSSLSGSTGAKTLGNLLSQYDGLLVGIQLQK